MPIVLESPVAQRYPDTRAYETGRAIIDPIRDVLLQALLGGRIGQVPTTPTPRNPGQLTFPSGATTRTSPQELTQLQQMGGVPSRQGDIVPFGQPATGGVQYTQPTRFGFLENLERQKTQAEIEKLRGDIAYQKQLPEILRQTWGGLDRQRVEDDAMTGDEDAVAAYRYLKRIGAF